MRTESYYTYIVLLPTDDKVRRLASGMRDQHPERHFHVDSFSRLRKYFNSLSYFMTAQLEILPF